MELVLESHPRSRDLEEEAPPSYSASLRSNVKSNWFPSHQEEAPSTNWFVRSPTVPSTWQLLASGPLMSNVTPSSSASTTCSRRYRILYPPSRYEDVFLHRPPWTSEEAAFPQYHVEIYSERKRYNVEAIVVLGPPEERSQSLTMEAKALLFLHISRVISAVESQVTNMIQQAIFAEMEFYSCDWKCKTAAANNDMRSIIMGAKQECAKSLDLVNGLEVTLGHVSGSGRETAPISLRRRCEEVRVKLERFRP